MELEAARERDLVGREREQETVVSWNSVGVDAFFPAAV
jgi:hypothetical protein